MAIKEFRILDVQNQMVMDFLIFIALFIPMPIGGDAKYTPDYVIGDWGFIYTIKIGKHLPLGWVMLLLAILL